MQQLKKKTVNAIQTLVSGVASMIEKESKAQKGKNFQDRKKRLFTCISIEGQHALLQEQSGFKTKPFKVRLDTFNKKFTSAKLSSSPERLVS